MRRPLQLKKYGFVLHGTELYGSELWCVTRLKQSILPTVDSEVHAVPRS